MNGQLVRVEAKPAGAGAIGGAGAAAGAAARGGRRRRWAVLGRMTLPALAGLAIVLVAAGAALAQGDAPAGGEDSPALSKPIMIMIAMASLSLAPFVLVMTTSFLKFSVVGSILRTAMGTQQVPPNQVLMGLSLILTIYVMAPVGRAIYADTQDLIDRSTEQGVLSDESVEIIKAAIERGKGPYYDFLMKHSTEKDRKLFLMLAEKLHQGDESYVPTERDFMTLCAAFVTSELTEAFQIGFILFVPFIVIDMIVSNVLLAMGMQMLSPTIISLPIKLLLFVLVDGWHLLMRGLVLGYV